MQPIGENLRRLRRTRGLTQAALAGAAGLSRPGYRAIETGASVPRVDTLQALAVALDLGIEDLVRPVHRLLAVRFRSAKKMRMREQILADVARWLDDFNELESLLEVGGEEAVAVVQQRISERRDVVPQDAARMAREVLGLAVEPIRDICGLLDAHGVKVLPLSVATDTFFGLSVSTADGGPAIVVNTWERISVERWIFTAAHELGHLVVHSNAYDIDQSNEENAQEEEANVFASHFLMPDQTFRSEWEETYGMSLWERVLKAKRMFRVSYRTVLHRLAQPRYIGSDVWAIFQAESKKHTGRTLLEKEEPQRLAASAFKASFPEPHRAGEPERLSPLDFREGRLPSLVRRAVEKRVITLSRGAEILGLSLEAMRDLASSWAG